MTFGRMQIKPEAIQDQISEGGKFHMSESEQ